MAHTTIDITEAPTGTPSNPAFRFIDDVGWEHGLGYSQVEYSVRSKSEDPYNPGALASFNNWITCMVMLRMFAEAEQECRQLLDRMTPARADFFSYVSVQCNLAICLFRAGEAKLTQAKAMYQHICKRQWLLKNPVVKDYFEVLFLTRLIKVDCLVLRDARDNMLTLNGLIQIKDYFACTKSTSQGVALHPVSSSSGRPHVPTSFGMIKKINISHTLKMMKSSLSSLRHAAMADTKDPKQTMKLGSNPGYVSRTTAVDPRPQLSMPLLPKQSYAAATAPQPSYRQRLGPSAERDLRAMADMGDPKSSTGFQDCPIRYLQPLSEQASMHTHLDAGLRPSSFDMEFANTAKTTTSIDAERYRQDGPKIFFWAYDEGRRFNFLGMFVVPLIDSGTSKCWISKDLVDAIGGQIRPCMSDEVFDTGNGRITPIGRVKIAFTYDGLHGVTIHGKVNCYVTEHITLGLILSQSYFQSINCGHLFYPLLSARSAEQKRQDEARSQSRKAENRREEADAIAALKQVRRMGSISSSATSASEGTTLWDSSCSTKDSIFSSNSGMSRSMTPATSASSLRSQSPASYRSPLAGIRPYAPAGSKKYTHADPPAQSLQKQSAEAPRKK